MASSCCLIRKCQKQSEGKTLEQNKKDSEEDEDPRDRGWAWVIAIAVGTFNMLLDGTSKSNGLLYLEWLQLHGQNPAVTAWARTSHSLMQIVTTPISAYLKDRLSFQSIRIVIFVGGIIWALSFCVAGWMPNVEGIIVSYGICGGIASGLIITPIFSSIPDFFVKRRSLASGIALGGGSVGGLLVPILVANLTEIYSIRGAMTIIGGLYLHTLVVAAVMIPLRKPKVEGAKSLSTAEGRSTRKINVVKSMKDGSCVNEAFALEENETVEFETTNQRIITSRDETRGLHDLQDLDSSQAYLGKSIPESIDCAAADSWTKDSSADTQTDEDTSDIRRGDCKDNTRDEQQPSRTEVKTSVDAAMPNACSSQPVNNHSESGREEPGDTRSSSSNRRADISSKIRNLKLVRATKTYIDFLRTPHLIPLTLTFLCGSFAYFSQFLVLVPFTTELGGSKVMASTIISIMSVTELFGRLLTGYVADRLGKKKMWLLFASLIISFIVGIIIIIFPSTDLLFAYAVVFGIFGGMYMPLTIPMATDLVSSNQFGKATGLLPIVVGLGIATGNQAATAVYEETNLYKYSLLLCVCMYLGALFFFGIYAFGLFQKGQKEKAVIAVKVA